MFVDKDSAYRLNSGEEKLEDILVLHLHGGKDFFISFEKTSMPSYVSYLPKIFGQITGCPLVRDKSGKFFFSSRSGKSQGIL